MPDESTQQQIIDYIHANFPPDQWATAESIAARESGYNPLAINNTSRPDLPGYHIPGPHDLPEYSIGLFQINTGAWPQIAQQFDLSDPLSNVQAAYQIWQQSGWLPWGIINSSGSQGSSGGSGQAFSGGGGGGGSGADGAASTGYPDWKIGTITLAGTGKIAEFFANLAKISGYLLDAKVWAILAVRLLVVIIGVAVALLGLNYVVQSLGKG